MEKKKRYLENTVWLSIVAFIVFGQIYWLSGGLRLPPVVIVAGYILLATVLGGAIFLNIRVLVPCLLFRNRFAAYFAVLLALSAGFTAIEIWFGFTAITRYHVKLQFGYYEESSFFVLEVLGAVIPYFICLIGTTVIIFFRRWRQSDFQIRDMEGKNIRTEVEKAKTQIDSNALFDVLDRAAGRVARSPAGVVAELMDLSKSLREQLYESRMRQQALPEEPFPQAFDLSSPVLKFVSEKRNRPLWPMFLTGIVLLLHTANFNNTLASVWLILFLTVIFMALICFNIYVLIPGLLLKNKGFSYAVTLVGSIAVVIGGILLLTEGGVILILSNVLKISLFLAGITVFVLFRHWLGNEQYIARIRAAALRSELEQLQNQVNPHFLFNMLNNIIVLAKENPTEAEAVLRKLSSMLKYQYKGAEQMICLADDICFLTDYLNLEKLRRDRFEFRITTKGKVEGVMLPPLLFIPFVENAVKHNFDSRDLSFVHLCFEKNEDGGLRFTCSNSKPSAPKCNGETGGLGLTNVRRRLDLLYGKTYQLKITEDRLSFHVELTILNI